MATSAKEDEEEEEEEEEEDDDGAEDEEEEEEDTFKPVATYDSNIFKRRSSILGNGIESPRSVLTTEVAMRSCSRSGKDLADTRINR